jgi:hypothetical protein
MELTVIPVKCFSPAHEISRCKRQNPSGTH